MTVRREETERKRAKGVEGKGRHNKRTVPRPVYFEFVMGHRT